MSQIVEQVKNKVELEKKAYFEYVKSFSGSSIATLVQGGIAFDRAAELTKQACEVDARAVGMLSTIAAFEKVAEYVEQLEVKVSELEKSAGVLEAEVKAATSEPLNKLASIGFTKEEIEQISMLPENLQEKVASVNSQPWEMGAGAGIPREKTDPMLEFLIG